MRRLPSALPRTEIVVLVVALVATLLYAMPWREPGWDAAVYWGAGKFLWSVGSAGLWEPLRPPVMPIVFGLLWRIGVPPLVAFMLVGIVVSLAIYLLLFAIGRSLGIRRSWAIALATLSPVLLFSSPRGLTEAPAVALALAAILLLHRKRLFLAGIVAALAFLTKFPMGLVVVALVCAAFINDRGKRRSIRRSVSALAALGAGFAIPVLVYLVANMVAYGNPFLPFIEGSRVIAQAGIWLYQQSPLFYVIEALRENVLLILAVPGVVLALRKRTPASLAVSVAAILLLLYFSVTSHKEVRFLVLFLPFLGLIAAVALDAAAKRWRFLPVLCLLVLLQLMCAGNYWWHYIAPYDATLHDADARLSVANGTILVSNPRPALAIDSRLALMYYPIYNADLSARIQQMLPDYRAILYSDCDLVCDPADTACDKAKASLAAAVNTRAANAIDTFTVQRQGCTWRYVLS
jgi:4-amino-4-deoxy-L-arabinose transferase-like glycosyltransferase